MNRSRAIGPIIASAICAYCSLPLTTFTYMPTGPATSPLNLLAFFALWTAYVGEIGMWWGKSCVSWTISNNLRNASQSSRRRNALNTYIIHFCTLATKHRQRCPSFSTFGLHRLYLLLNSMYLFFGPLAGFLHLVNSRCNILIIV